ncbi:four helix bundle protein [Flavobacterium sp. SM15]|uniref:four helix bundle protein n=1 Tax=Flavobacterium sp. SM15 TaxID=2908005 RepID=UPI001EDA8905|nr:four helix bundle protein [Flavobacterium sp. SM15]MCG2611383.1 four helix bundle protein [Flavobacterium sp. SM15]
MSGSIVKNKSYQLAINGVKFCQLLQQDKKEFILSKQLLRSITSIGANVREAVNAQSKPDFIHKLSISQKECDESLYWLELLRDTQIVSEEEFLPIHNQAIEVRKIIRSIIITSKKNLPHNS